MTARDKLYSVADLAALNALPENRDKHFELVGGMIFEMPTGTLEHAYIIGEIFGYLREFVRQHQLGYVFPDGATYVLSDEDEFIPDVSFISNAHFQGLGAKQRGAPDLAVEVISPSNHPLDMLFKIERYFRFGTQEIWLVYPEERVVYVYDLNRMAASIYAKFNPMGYWQTARCYLNFRYRFTRFSPPNKRAVSPKVLFRLQCGWGLSKKQSNFSYTCTVERQFLYV